MYRSDFCIAGAFRDIFLFRDYLRLRALLLLVALLAFSLYLMRSFQVISTYPPSFFGMPSAASLLGGFLFGAGMVLGGGCLLGTLYKLGGGSMASAITFCGVLFGGITSAALYPFVRSFVYATALFSSKTALEHIIGSAAIPVFAASLVMMVLAWRWTGQRTRPQRAVYARGYLAPWKAAFMMAAVITALLALSGRPPAVNMGFEKLSGILSAAVLPSVAGKISYFHIQSPRLLYGSIMDGGAGPVMDSIAISQLPLMAGIAGGSLISSLRLREFRIKRLPPARQAFSAFAGGMLMAAGAFMAGGCNLWHMIGGLPVLALQSILFVFGIAGGSYLGTAFLKKQILEGWKKGGLQWKTRLKTSSLT
ncbi:MAG: YeeE/YedE thiosulfate transporter family protein [Candidatus Sulfobium sp.]|jgi:uncharacterized membrane protein YedE/YeeE